MSSANPLSVTPDEVLLRSAASRMTLAELSDQIRRAELAIILARREADREKHGWRLDILKREVAIRASQSHQSTEASR